jgi:TetR/AcrR family transcriptional repressor of nem operon
MSTVGRPLEFCPDAALEAAMQQFWSRGYEPTSLQDLLTAMQLSKSSLYQTFGGKEPLFRQCLRRYTEQLTGKLRELLQQAPSGLAFLREFLGSAALDLRHPTGPRGCLLMNTATEFAQSDPAIAADVANCLDEFRDVLIAAVKRAQRDGEVARKQDPRQLADFLLCSMSGLKTQAKAGADAATLQGIAQLVLRALA